jgi:glycosyltransferase involved in cell wall biosynthesis
MRVAVLMSTYNGSRYVGEQLTSILAQMPDDGILLVRDDGSSDNTITRIEALADPRIHLVRGPNVGFAHSFLTLLAAAPATAQMVMFSDQDDIWLPGKIDRAWQHLLHLGEQPGLYCSAQTLTDEALTPLQVTPPWPRGPSFQSALAENIVTGCTAALNQRAVMLLKEAGVAAGVRFHDWWFYLVVSAFGTVVVDDQPTLLYRQHAANVIGHGVGWWGRQWQMIRFLISHDWVGILLAQVDAFQNHYFTRLSGSQRKLLKRYFVQRGARQFAPAWRMVFSWRRWRQSGLQEIMFRCLLAAHRLNLWPLPGRRL